MLGLVAACSPVTVLNTLAPQDGITVTTGIAYGEESRQRLDVYTPAVTPAPVVLFVYGGGWQSGERAMYRFVAASLAARGFVVVVPDYRLYPEVRFPAFLQDGAGAIGWTYRTIAQYGGEPDAIHLMGHSAGAWTVMMLTLDRQWLQAEGLDPDRVVAGTIGVSGPYDFLPLREAYLQDMFAPAGDLRLTQPVTFARGDAPPLLLIHGMDDQRVWPRNTERLAERMRAKGGWVEERIYPRIGHTAIIGAVARPLQWLAPITDDVVAFLRLRETVR